MNRRLFIISSVLVVIMSCSKAPETSTTANTSTTSTTSTQATATTAPPPSTTQTMPNTATTAAAAPATAVLQSQETNWTGVIAEVTEFRRKGNSLTAKVRLSNKGSGSPDVQIFWNDVALIDAAGGKKYEVLKDEKGAYISSSRAGWPDRWEAHMGPGASQVIWMKFPAPPPEVKTITLQIPQVPPFDDLQIQD